MTSRSFERKGALLTREDGFHRRKVEGIHRRERKGTYRRASGLRERERAEREGVFIEELMLESL